MHSSAPGACARAHVLHKPVDTFQVEGIDEDAAAYLRAVREEASRIPHVTASVRRYGEPEPPVHHDPHDTAVSQPPPMMDWIHSVVDGFVEARQQVHHQVCAGPLNSHLK